jgi:hypothetical protein
LPISNPSTPSVRLRATCVIHAPYGRRTTPPILRAPSAIMDPKSRRDAATLLWIPPTGSRAGDILVVDSTVFSTLFGVDQSLEQFWRNIATAM